MLTLTLNLSLTVPDPNLNPILNPNSNLNSSLTPDVALALASNLWQFAAVAFGAVGVAFCHTVFCGY